MSHPKSRAERRAKMIAAKARAVRRIKLRSMEPTDRRIGVLARTPAPCSCNLCRAYPYERPSLRDIIAVELAAY